MSKRSKKSTDPLKRRSVESKPTDPAGKGPDTAPKSHMPSQAAFRELIESVVIAFVLAFLFRTFEAEAFVIPTGSMATTLMGRHKDVICPECGYNYQVGASMEVDQVTGSPTGQVVAGGTCPMCRYTDLRLQREPSFNGDRILVGKFLYEYDEPERFDVAVFRYPADAKVNYIKRVAGLPGETIRISHGDLFVRKDGEAEFHIVRKTPAKLRAMLKPVYDDNYPMPEKLRAAGWPERWQSADGAGGWQASEDHRSFTTDGTLAETWLRYRHIVPGSHVWAAIERGAATQNLQPVAQLISDFCAYNTTLERSSGRHEAQGLGLHWVGDLAVECCLDVRAAAGKVVFELVEGGYPMQCRIDLATGEAVLSIAGQTLARAANTPIHKPGAYNIYFANADDELRLWVNDELIEFDGPTTFAVDNRQPREADLSPVGIASQGANVQIAHLKVLRDVYYIADRAGAGGPISDFVSPGAVFPQFDRQVSFEQAIEWLLSHPDKYDTSHMQDVEFTLKKNASTPEKDQFLVLGDNSPQSKDSRLWGPEYWVDRELLVGKALYVYWPHSWDKVTVGGATIPFPFFPNVERMEFVR
jgi:signal peptidase I